MWTWLEITLSKADPFGRSLRWTECVFKLLIATREIMIWPSYSWLSQQLLLTVYPVSSPSDEGGKAI